jgi:hypothetical protein
MGVQTERYIRKPLYVDAVRVEPQNFDELVTWCQGTVMTQEVEGTGTIKKYIKVRVNNPKNLRQTQAFIGDWILYTDRGYKVYTHKAFRMAFDLVEDETPKEHEESPGVRLGNVSSSPEEKDQLAAQKLDAPLSEDEEVAVQAEEEALEGLEERRIHAEAPTAPPQNEEHTLPAAAPVLDESSADVEEVVVEPVSEGVTVESSPTSPPVAPQEAEGKYVITREEQKQLGADGVRELLASGEAVLEQDLAA